MTPRRRERPRWCGQCNPDTRCLDDDPEQVRRCPRCHASTQPGGRHAPRIRAPHAVPLELRLKGDQ